MNFSPFCKGRRILLAGMLAVAYSFAAYAQQGISGAAQAAVPETARTPVQAQQIPIVFIDSKRLLTAAVVKLGGDERQRLAKLNESIASLAIQNGLRLVLQDVVWVTPKLDATSLVLDTLDGKTVDFSPLRAVAKHPVSIALVAPDKLMEQSGRRFRGGTQDQLDQANKMIVSMVKPLGLDVVLGAGVWWDQAQDLTPYLLAVLKGETPNEALLHRMSGLAPKLAYVDVRRLFRNSEKSRQAAKRLEAEFDARDRELADWAKTAKSDGTLDDFQTAMRRFNADLNKRKSEENQKILELANRAVRSIALEDGYDLVLQDTISVASHLDITDRIITAVDRQ